MEPKTEARTRRVGIHHATNYVYDKPIGRSVHYIHLSPRSSDTQTLRSFSLSIEPSVPWTQFEDIWGNATGQFEVHGPFDRLSLVAESTVDVLDADPFAFDTPAVRPMFPISWTLAEHQRLSPYLMDMDLNRAGINEIDAYAQSVAARNRQDVLETVFDINLTLFREFKYRPGSTTVETSASEVLRTKQGVCQDFANLFISMARRLQIPARYVCGYVLSRDTSPSGSGDASHAWVQLYLPGIGWKDFDPTNGSLPAADHVAGAWGPTYRDSAPVWGTMYSMSQAKETMTVDVRVTDLGYAPEGE